MYSISVVIPNYNGEALLKSNIPSVYQALSSSNITDNEIIIADDASKDRSLEFIEKHYPEIILIKNPVNLGFSGNCNTGIQKAKKDLVFILNNDVKLSDKYFVPLLPYFDKKDTFGVGGRFMFPPPHQKLQGVAKYPICRFAHISSTKNYLCDNQNSLYSWFISGAGLLADHKKLLSLGGFNELFNPYYGEDADLGFRAWRSGFKLYYEHTSVCFHANSTTTKKEHPDKVKIISKRNKFILHYLHCDGIELYCFFILVCLKSIGNLLLFNKNYLQSLKLFLFSFSKIAKYKKQHIKAKSMVPLKNVERMIKQAIKDEKIKVF